MGRSIMGALRLAGSTSQRRYREWKKEWNWDNRCAAWDMQVDQETQSEVMKTIAKMRERHAKLSETILDRIEAALESLSPKDLTPTHIAKLFESAIKMERLSRGEATSFHKSESTTTHVLDEQSLAAAEQLAKNPESREQLLDMLRKARQPSPSTNPTTPTKNPGEELN